MENIVIEDEIDYVWTTHQSVKMNMEMQLIREDYFRFHEDIPLGHHELLLMFQCDQLNAGIPFFLK